MANDTKINFWIPSLPPAREYKKENLREIERFSQFIYTVGEYPILRSPSIAVIEQEMTSNEMKQKYAYLKKCMREFRRITKGKGRGIAGVQVGIPERFFLLYQPGIKKPFTIIINPVVTKKSIELLSYPESCMSANSLIADVIRPAWIEFEYFNEWGQKQYWQLKATTKQGKMYNRIVQHEIDHLDGIINIDYVPASSLIFEMGTEYYGKARFRKISKK